MPTGNPPAMPGTELSPAQKSRLLLADAEAMNTEALALHAERQAATEELMSFLTSGRASLGDLDSYGAQLASSRFAEEVAGLLVKNCEVSVKRATAALINDDIAVADLIANVLNDVYGGRLPMRVVTLRDDVKPNDNGDPVLYIVQSQPGENDRGILSATLDLTFYRPSLFAPLEGRTIEEACRKRNYAVNIDMRSPIDRGDYFEDPMRVSVTRAFLPVPEFSRDPDDDDLHQLALSLSNSLRNSVTAPGRMPQVYASEESNGRARMEQGGHNVVSRKASDGGRRMVVEVSCKVWPDVELDRAPAALLREAVDGHVGLMAEGVGRVVAVEYVDVVAPKLGHFSDALPFVVTAHLAVTYQVA